MLRLIAKIAIRFLQFWYGLFKSEDTLDVQSLESVLFIETTKMGDVLSMLPLVQCFHDEIPAARLIIAVEERYTDIVKCLPFNVDIVALGNTRQMRSFRKAMKKLSSLKPDLSVSISPAQRNALLSLCTSSRFKIGYFDSYTSTTPFLYRSKVGAIGFMLNKGQEYYLENISKRSLKISHGLGLSVSDTILKLSAPKLFTNQAEMLLKRLGIDQIPFAIIHPFSGWFYRSWSIENFAIVAHELAEEGMHSILIGSKADADTLAAKMEFKRNVHLLFDESLAAVIGLIGKASLFIGNDSGPLHLATALGIPCVGMYGPASPTLTAPRSNKNIYLYKQVECSPCNQTHCIRQHDPCINLISSGDVVHAAISILKREAAGAD